MRWQRLPPALRFIVVGGINTLFGFGAYAFFLWVGVHYAGATLLGTIMGIVFNFFSVGGLVFDRVHGVRSAVQFIGVYAVAYAINVAGLAGLDRLGVGPYAAGFVLIVPMAVVSFALMRRFVFGWVHVAH